MSTAEQDSIVPSLLAGVVDYAGLFPPAAHSMSDSVKRFAAHQRSSRAAMLSRFIVPASRLEELSPFSGYFEAAHPLRLSVLAGGGASLPTSVAEAREKAERFCRDFEAPSRLEMIEARAPASLVEASESVCVSVLSDAAQASARTPLHVELPVVSQPDESAARVACFASVRSRGFPELGTKMRFGGATPGDYPNIQDTARFLHACIRHAVPLKATAGLHHPVRHWDETGGVTMHGFLNVLGAVVLGTTFAWNASQLVEVLGETDPHAFGLEDGTFRWRDYAAPATAVGMVRSGLFKGFGSCSLREPLEDLDKASWFGASAAVL